MRCLVLLHLLFVLLHLLFEVSCLVAGLVSCLRCLVVLHLDHLSLPPVSASTSLVLFQLSLCCSSSLCVVSALLIFQIYTTCLCLSACLCLPLPVPVRVCVCVRKCACACACACAYACLLAVLSCFRCVSVRVSVCLSICLSVCLSV